MPTYTESEYPTIIQTGNGNNGGSSWGNDGIWAILLLALLGGFGGRGFGFGGGSGGGSSSEFVGYELGKVATQADIASGFNNSAVLSSLNDIKLTQASNLNFINQGFAGLNNVINQGFAGVDNAICTLGYQNQAGFNAIAHQISDCCCATQRAIDGVNYNIAKQTSDLIVNQNTNTQRIFDYLTNEKIEGLRAENVALKGKISNAEQSSYLLSELKPCPKPAYLTCNPNTGLTYPQGYTNVNFGGNSCCGCGNGF